MAAGETSNKAIWLLRLLSEAEEKKIEPMSIVCDNQSAIRLVGNTEFHQRTKHIDVK